MPAEYLNDRALPVALALMLQPNLSDDVGVAGLAMGAMAPEPFVVKLVHILEQRVIGLEILLILVDGIIH